jgi:protein phosphatase 1 regulatory subunit 10
MKIGVFINVCITVIEFPLDPDFPVLEPRGGESVEAGVQEEREKNTLIASYMSPSRIPDTASDLHPGIGDTNPDDPPTVMMLPGAEVSGLNAEDLPPSTLSDLLAQIAAPSVASSQGPAPASASFDTWGQQPQPPQASTSASVSLLQQFGLSGMTSVDFSNLLSTVSPETIGLMQQQPSHPFNSGFSSQPQGFGGGDQAYWSDPSGGASQPSWGGTSEGWNDNHNGNGGSGNFGRGRGRGRGFGGGRGRGGGFDRPKKLCNFFAKG